LKDVGVYLRGGYVPVPEELLHGADVLTVFQQVGGERVAKGVGAGAFGDAGMPDRVPDRPLKDRLMEVVTAVLAGRPIDVDSGDREDPLPRPFAASVRVLAGEGPG
jgi:hypothetical protein